MSRWMSAYSALAWSSFSFVCVGPASAPDVARPTSTNASTAPRARWIIVRRACIDFSAMGRTTRKPNDPRCVNEGVAERCGAGTESRPERLREVRAGQPQRTGDQEPLYLARALADLERLRVAVVAPDRNLFGEAGTTVDLHGVASARHRRLAREQ